MKRQPLGCSTLPKGTPSRGEAAVPPGAPGVIVGNVEHPRNPGPSGPGGCQEYTPDDVVVLAREAAAVLRGFYDDLTPCIHSLKRGERCALCGRARALLVECDGIVSDAQIDGDA